MIFFPTRQSSFRAMLFLRIALVVGFVLLGSSKLQANALINNALREDTAKQITVQDTSKQDDTLRLGIPNLGPVYFWFDSQEQALDSLLVALLNKKGMPPHAFLNNFQFTEQWKLHDTGASQQVIDGFWLTYQYQFNKSFLKTRKWLKKNKISLRRSAITSKPKTIESSDGSGITKYEYKVTYKQDKYVFWFQLWWIDGKAYWVNDIGFRPAAL